MPLIMPVLPSRIFEFIVESYETAAELRFLAREIVSENPCSDLGTRLLACEETLDFQLDYVLCCTSNIHTGEVRRLFALKLLQALYFLRIHDAKSARNSVKEAEKLARTRFSFRQIDPPFNQTEVIEALGLISYLITQLEDRLARIEPCL